MYDLKAKHLPNYTAVGGPAKVPVMKPWIKPPLYGPRYGEFCRQILTAHVPWRQSPDDVLANPIPCGPRIAEPMPASGSGDWEDPWVTTFHKGEFPGVAPLPVQRLFMRLVREAKHETEKAIAKTEAVVNGRKVPEEEAEEEHEEHFEDVEEEDDVDQLFRRDANFRGGEGDGEGGEADNIDWSEACPQEWRDRGLQDVQTWLSE